MPYLDREKHNARRREKRREKKTQKTPRQQRPKAFVEWCSVPPDSIRCPNDDGIFYFDVRVGPLTLPQVRYNSETGQFHSTTVEMDPSKRPLFKSNWYVGHLRPLIIAAIEARFDIELPTFDDVAAEEPTEAKIASIKNDGTEPPKRESYARWVEYWQPHLTLEDHPGVTPERAETAMVEEGQPRDYVRRWIAENMHRFQAEVEPPAAVPIETKPLPPIKPRSNTPKPPTPTTAPKLLPLVKLYAR